MITIIIVVIVVVVVVVVIVVIVIIIIIVIVIIVVVIVVIVVVVVIIIVVARRRQCELIVIRSPGVLALHLFLWLTWAAAIAARHQLLGTTGLLVFTCITQAEVAVRGRLRRRRFATTDLLLRGWSSGCGWPARGACGFHGRQRRDGGTAWRRCRREMIFLGRWDGRWRRSNGRLHGRLQLLLLRLLRLRRRSRSGCGGRRRRGRTRGIRGSSVLTTPTSTTWSQTDQHTQLRFAVTSWWPCTLALYNRQ